MDAPNLSEACQQAINQHNFSVYFSMVPDGFLSCKHTLVTICKDAPSLQDAKLMCQYWRKQIARFFDGEFMIEVFNIETSTFYQV